MLLLPLQRAGSQLPAKTWVDNRLFAIRHIDIPVMLSDGFKGAFC